MRPTRIAVRGPELHRSQHSSRLGRNDPGASCRGASGDSHQKNTGGGDIALDRARHAGAQRERTLTYSTQAATILTPTEFPVSV